MGYTHPFFITLKVLTMLKIILLVFFLFLININSQTRWEKLDGPLGGRVTGLYSKGDTLLAGFGSSKALIYYSHNGGETWEKADLKLTYPGNIAMIVDFAVMNDGSTVAAYNNHQLYKSFNLQNWTQIYSAPGFPFNSLGNDSAGNIYAGTEDGTIISSTDNGLHWTIEFSNPQPAPPPIDAFYLTENHGLWSGTKSKLLYKTASSWNSILFDTIGQPLTLFFDDGDNLYANSWQWIYKSTNAGNSWVQKKYFPSEDMYNCIMINNRIIGAFSDETGWFGEMWGVYYSDNFIDWVHSTTGLPPKNSTTKVKKSNNDIYVTPSAAGIYKSIDYGESWFAANSGITECWTLSILLCADGRIYTMNWGNSIQVSTDKGLTWKGKNKGLTNSYCYSIIENQDNILFAGTDEGVFTSTNDGEQWVQTTFVGNDFCTYLEKDSFNRVYRINRGDGIYRSSDLGISWEKIDNGINSIWVNAIAIDSSNNLYAGTRYGDIFKSTDDGYNWFLVKEGSDAIFAISVSPNGSVFATSRDEGVLRSTDNGVSWLQVKNGISGIAGKAIAINRDGDIFVSVAPISVWLWEVPEKVYRSTDNGESWMNYTSNLNQISVFDIGFDEDDNVYLATDASVWRSNPDSTTSVSDNVSQLFRYSLEQNYPNPFNPTTKINYSIGEQEFVQLSLYNILGEEVAKLVEEIKSAGSYSVSFDASAFPGGVYVYRLQAGGYSSARKMILLR